MWQEYCAKYQKRHELLTQYTINVTIFKDLLNIYKNT